MSEDDIRGFLNRQALGPGDSRIKTRKVVVNRVPKRKSESTFKDFSATHLFCSHCKRPMPVRESVLLYLPDGDLYQYSCTACGTGLGTRKVGH